MHPRQALKTREVTASRSGPAWHPAYRGDSQGSYARWILKRTEVLLSNIGPIGDRTSTCTEWGGHSIAENWVLKACGRASSLRIETCMIHISLATRLPQPLIWLLTLTYHCLPYSGQLARPSAASPQVSHKTFYRLQLLDQRARTAPPPLKPYDSPPIICIKSTSSLLPSGSSRLVAFLEAGIFIKEADGIYAVSLWNGSGSDSHNAPLHTVPVTWICMACSTFAN